MNCQHPSVAEPSRLIQLISGNARISTVDVDVDVGMWQLGPGAFGHGIPLGRAFRPEPGASHIPQYWMLPASASPRTSQPESAARTGSVVTGRTGSTRGRHVRLGFRNVYESGWCLRQQFRPAAP
jgi:hypothetical protein